MNKKPNILVVNDDGFGAPGLITLVKVARKFGRVTVVVPDRVRSGASHAITFNHPLMLEKMEEAEDYVQYAANGTPIDCFKLGQRIVLAGEKIDLILSGINLGDNTSVSVIYSGTMAVAMEGCFENIPAIGLSLCSFDKNADFSAAEVISEKIIAQVLKNGLPERTCLNVNIPALPLKEIKGIKLTRQAKGYWDEDFIITKVTHGRTCYWLDGNLCDLDQNTDTDEWATKHGYVSVQPVQVDVTAYKHFETLKPFEEVIINE